MRLGVLNWRHNRSQSPVFGVAVLYPTGSEIWCFWYIKTWERKIAMEKTFLLHLSAHWGDLIKQIKKKSVIYTLMTALVWSFACTRNAMLLSSINVQHFRDIFFCKVLCSCCVSLKVVSDQISGPVFSHYFSWLHNMLHNNTLLYILHALSWLSNPDWNILDICMTV